MAGPAADSIGRLVRCAARTSSTPIVPGETRIPTRTGQVLPAVGLSVMLPDPLAEERSTNSVLRFQYWAKAVALAPSMSSSCTGAGAAGGGRGPGAGAGKGAPPPPRSARAGGGGRPARGAPRPR